MLIRDGCMTEIEIHWDEIGINISSLDYNFESMLGKELVLFIFLVLLKV